MGHGGQVTAEMTWYWASDWRFGTDHLPICSPHLSGHAEDVGTSRDPLSEVFASDARSREAVGRDVRHGIAWPCCMDIQYMPVARPEANILSGHGAGRARRSPPEGNAQVVYIDKRCNHRCVKVPPPWRCPSEVVDAVFRPGIRSRCIFAIRVMVLRPVRKLGLKRRVATEQQRHTACGSCAHRTGDT